MKKIWASCENEVLLRKRSNDELQQVYGERGIFEILSKRGILSKQGWSRIS